MTADDILKALKNKHATEMFVSECKTGSSWYGGGPRMDFWVCHPTWKACRATGYETKVSRSDFLNDHKWPEYLPYCNAFYFVCPPKLIQPEELPAEAGLMWCCGSRLITKKKAPLRLITLDPDVYHYVLMWRQQKAAETKLDRMAKLEAMLEDRDRRVSLNLKVKARIAEEISGARETLIRAQRMVEGIKEVQDMVLRLTGMTVRSKWDARVVAEKIARDSNHEMGRDVQRMARELAAIGGKLLDGETK